jgi:hypothetical protein
MKSAHEYRDLDPIKDWEFFHKGDEIPAGTLPEIRPLAENSAIALWNAHVCSLPSDRHPMLVSDDSWLAALVSVGDSIDWLSEWTTPQVNAFTQWLRSKLQWAADDRVIFTHDRSCSVETSWLVFHTHWRNFVFDDEGPFLWRLDRTEVVQFMPNGRAYFGVRKVG